MGRVITENVFRQHVQSYLEPGWRSGYRAGLEILVVRKVGKPASGPLARRGSSPFPGATNINTVSH